MTSQEYALRIWGALCLMLSLSACGDSGLAPSSGGSVTELAPQAHGISPALNTKSTFAPALVPTVYRFAKISNGSYFYTGSDEEAQTIIKSYPDFRYEGPAFERDISGQGQPVFRFANLRNGGYFYTGSVEERDIVIRDYAHMRYEGSTYSVAPQGSSLSKPVYRLANLVNGAYLYTLSDAERDYAVSLGQWRFEGTSFRAPPGSPFDGKVWKPGQAVEKDDFQLTGSYSVGIDDDGNAIAVFSKQENNRNVLYAARATKTVSGDLAWGTPKAIDLTSAQIPLQAETLNYPVRLHVSAGGNAIVTWSVMDTCLPTSYLPSGTCRFIAYAKYIRNSNTWSDAQRLVSSPENSGLFQTARINDAGDLAIFYPGFVPCTDLCIRPYFERASVVWLQAGGQAYQIARFSDLATSGTYDKDFAFTVDDAGRMTLVAQYFQMGAVDLLVYWGLKTTGFGAQIIVDQGSYNVTLQDVATSRSGRTAILYDQYPGLYNGRSNQVAYADFGQANWQFFDEGTNTGGWKIYAADDGQVRLQNFATCERFTIDGAAQSRMSIPSPCAPSASYYSSDNRNGDRLFVESVNGRIGRWSSYDSKRNKFVQELVPATTASSAGYMLGFDPPSFGWQSAALAISPGGNAVFLSNAQYDQLPTPNLAQGVARINVKSLWALYLN